MRLLITNKCVFASEFRSHEHCPRIKNAKLKVSSPFRRLTEIDGVEAAGLSLGTVAPRVEEQREKKKILISAQTIVYQNDGLQGFTFCIL